MLVGVQWRGNDVALYLENKPHKMMTEIANGEPPFKTKGKLIKHKGHWFPAVSFPDRQFEAIRNFPLNDSDILVASYQRSGCMRRCVYQILPLLFIAHRSVVSSQYQLQWGRWNLKNAAHQLLIFLRQITLPLADINVMARSVRLICG